jgi:hypothetical protein
VEVRAEAVKCHAQGQPDNLGNSVNSPGCAPGTE